MPISKINGKVSIIVPVYNGEKYLETCIESILKQSYPNFELLLINDGSTDSSSKICHRYEADARVIVYDRGNYGVSRTRNFGIKKAEGEYLLFIDCDDFIERDMLEVLMTAVTSSRADCAVCGIVHDTKTGSRNFPRKRVTKVCNGIEAVKEILINQIATAGPVCKLFSKHIIPEEMFPCDLTIGEDAVGVISAFLRAERVAFDTKCCYHYNHREESLMSSPFSMRDMDLITAYDRIEKLLLENQDKFNNHGDLWLESRFRMIWSRFHVFDKILLTKEKRKAENVKDALDNRNREKEILLWLRKHIKEILSNPYVGKKRKLSMCVLLFSRKLYMVIIKKRNYRLSFL